MPIDIDGEIYYSVNEACEYLSITRDTLYRRIHEGQLQKYTLGAKKRTYFRLKDLDTLRTPRPTHEGKNE